MSAGTNRIITPLIVVFILATTAPTFAGQIIYVDDDSHGSNDGSSWEDAYNYLQDALAAAWFGDEIQVASNRGILFGALVVPDTVVTQAEQQIATVSVRHKVQNVNGPPGSMHQRLPDACVGAALLDENQV